MLTATVSMAEDNAGSAVSAGDARQRILQATMQCFRACGYEKSSMKLISAKAGVSQTLLHYHFETKEKLFQAAIDDMAKTMFATASAQLPQGLSVHDGLTEAASLLYTLFIDNLDAVTFIVEFAAAANHNEFLWTAYVDYRDTQRRQLLRCCVLSPVTMRRGASSTSRCISSKSCCWACRCSARSFPTFQASATTSNFRPDARLPYR